MEPATDIRRAQPVSRHEIEALLTEISAHVTDRNAGIFGPGSISWRINRESALFLGAGRAALLQLAHPWVAAALRQHSSLLNQPIARFHNTFRIVFTMVFGTADQALAAARHLYARHTRIAGELAEDTAAWKRGDRYEANEINALRWVYATLVESALLAYEAAFGALSREHRERYYQETKTLAALFGIPAASLPVNLEDFSAYIREMCQAGDSSGALGVTADARAMAHNLLAGAGSWIRPPQWYRALTASWLPACFRREFQLNFGPAEQLSAARALRRIPAVYRRLPAAIRFIGPWHEAQARLSGRPPSPIARLSNRFWIGAAQMPFSLEA
ncbi:MAG: oxygenase MpaB family protein [Terracidiphilus sp.]